MTKDILLDANHNIVFVNGDMVMTNKQQSLPQRIKQKLLSFRGEWFLDETRGLPFIEEILVKDYNLSRIEAIYLQELKNIEGISEILAFDISVDDRTRKMTINIRVLSTNNETVEIII
jgi:hypothetical protein